MTEAITDKTFSEETDSGLVLIDFWATWCGPCRMQAPILEQLSEEYGEGELKIVKMDVDENPETPASFGIMSIPTLLLKKDGEVVEKAIGVHSKDQLQALIAKHQ
ncbi:thioredoxin [Enterococcus sp. JM4C]|uniref:thioredoxin n=1 Tax=Candidatus Enterococcus huntleyi TaxID=1857217 RepID=UPI00137984E9|nr:thioredoxin [Enterococcus sp. JM4C]KAF1295706.1 thioredoxin [Enterococcus sp. JM4C]